MLIAPREESQGKKLKQKFYLHYEIVCSAQKGLSGFHLSNQQLCNPENVKLDCHWSIHPLQVVDTWGNGSHKENYTKKVKISFLSLHHQIPSASFLPQRKDRGVGKKMRRCLWVETQDTVLEVSGRHSTWRKTTVL